MRQTVLFVDDEPNILRALERLLSRGPYRVVLASDAQEALETFDRERPQVVVSDQRMPVTSGIDLLRTVRQRNPDVIRILMTGCPGPEEIEAERNGEIFRLLPKPWANDELKTALLDAFARFARNFAGGEWTDAAPDHQRL